MQVPFIDRFIFNNDVVLRIYLPILLHQLIMLGNSMYKYHMSSQRAGLGAFVGALLAWILNFHVLCLYV